MTAREKKFFALKYIGRLSEAGDRHMREQLREKGLGHLSPSHCEILTFLGRETTASPRRIALAINRDKSTITSLIRKLEDQKLIKRKENDQDARGFFLELTGAGKKACRVVLGIWRELNERSNAGLTARESEQLYKLLEKMYADFQ